MVIIACSLVSIERLSSILHFSFFNRVPSSPIAPSSILEYWKDFFCILHIHIMTPPIQIILPTFFPQNMNKKTMIHTQTHNKLSLSNTHTTLSLSLSLSLSLYLSFSLKHTRFSLFVPLFSHTYTHTHTHSHTHSHTTKKIDHRFDVSSFFKGMSRSMPFFQHGNNFTKNKYEYRSSHGG